jgi:hypothetical protein
MRGRPKARGRKKRAARRRVRAPASRMRRLTTPHAPPERYWIMTMLRHPTPTPIQKRNPNR